MKMYFLLNIGICQPAMLDYQRVSTKSYGRLGGLQVPGFFLKRPGAWKMVGFGTRQPLGDFFITKDRAMS